MILFTTSTGALKLVTAGTQTLDVHTSYVDVSGTTVTPGATNSAISSATTTSIVPASGTAVQRNVKHVSICNKDSTSSVGLLIQHYDGTTTIQLIKITLLAGYTFTYNDLDGWVLIDASGGRVESPLAGRWLKRTVILNGTTTFTTGPSTNTIVARLVAGGGQGGGSPATTGVEGAGAGAGSYAEWNVAVSPNTAYTCAVGAGGTTGGTNAAGQNGGNTTLAVGATTVTCNGGTGGPVGTSISVPVLGGAGGAISTNGSVNTGGGAGSPPTCTGTAANNASGKGGDSELGAGGAALLNASNATGNAAVGFGGGGGGSSSTGTARAGGPGSNGVIIVDEYS